MAISLIKRLRAALKNREEKVKEFGFEYAVGLAMDRTCTGVLFV